MQPGRVVLNRYVGIRGREPVFSNITRAAVELNQAGAHVELAAPIDDARRIPELCRAALSWDEPATIVHLEVHGHTGESDRVWGLRAGDEPTGSYRPGDQTDRPKLAPGLLVVGSCWGGAPGAAQTLKHLFDPGTLVLAADAVTYRVQVDRVVTPVLLAGVHLGPAHARQAMCERLESIRATTRTDRHWRLATLEEVESGV